MIDSTTTDPTPVASLASLASNAPMAGVVPILTEQNVPEQYELLLSKLARAEHDLESNDEAGRSTHLEEASGIVFDLLYSLDFRHGGELVPRLAALYGYIANQLLVVGKSRDRLQLAHLRDMITTLRQSWYDGRAG